MQPLLSEAAINEQVLTSNWMSDLGRANYEGGFVALHKRTSHGLTFDMNYTLSHILDQLEMAQADDVSPSYSLNLNYDYRPALYDRRRVFNFYLLDELPLGKGHRYGAGDLLNKFISGWFWCGIFTVSSDLPLALPEGSCHSAAARVGTASMQSR